MSPTPRTILLSVLLLAFAAGASAEPDAALRAPGDSLVDVLQRRDAATLTARFDVDALANRVLDGLELPESDKRDIAIGFRKASADLGGNFVRNLDFSNASVRLVDARKLGAGSVQVVRLDLKDQAGEPAGYDWIEFELGADGRIRDWRSQAQGSRVSETMRLLVVTMFDNSSLVASLFGRTSVDQDALGAMNEFTAAMKAKDIAKAHAALGRLPEGFRSTRQWASLRASLSSTLDEKLYRADLQLLADQHGEDPNVQLMLFDHYLYKQQYPQMLESIRRFEKRVVSDGATNALECMALDLVRQWDEAERACRDAVRIQPDFKDAWFQLLGVVAVRKDAPATVATIQEIERRFETELDPEVLLENESYSFLEKDPAFVEWAATRRAD